MKMLSAAVVEELEREYANREFERFYIEAQQAMADAAAEEELIALYEEEKEESYDLDRDLEEFRAEQEMERQWYWRNDR